MAVIASEPPEDKLSSLWRSACSDYAKETGVTLTDAEFPKIRGLEDLSVQLDTEKDNFEDFRMKRRPLFHAMQMIMVPFENFGGLIADVASAAFPPASSIMGAMLLLVRGARRVSEAFNMITDLFHKLGNFALRLDSYKGVPLSEGMKVTVVSVLVNFLRVCAASQKIVRHGSFRSRLSKWAKNVLVEDTSISSLLGELEDLTSQEHLMVSAHSLNLTNQALKNTEELLDRDNIKNDRERLERVKSSLNPDSASGQVFSSISANRIPGSGSWIEDRIRTWQQGSQPLLWLHGGPGVGKSHLASKIIADLSKSETSTTGPPAVASFFFKSNNVDLRSLNKALRALAWQVATQLPSFALHAEEFALRGDPENNYVVWKELLQDFFLTSPSHAAICFVIDGIDEADPKEQEVLFSLLENTFGGDDGTTQSPPLRVVLLSRDSVRPLIDEHSLDWIPEIEIGNEQNKDDLHQYISQKLQKAKVFRGSPDFQNEIVGEISREAEGLWEWANLVIQSVLRCRTKEQIRKVVKTMPRGISAMLHQELQRLSRELSLSDEMYGDEGPTGETAAPQIEQLNILLSFVTLAQKPLTVLQLDLILEIIMKEEALNLEDDIRTVYSSLFSTTATDEQEPFDTSDIVTLRHTSFYEFFKTSVELGPIHVDVDRAEASFVYVSLYATQEESTPTSSRSMQELCEYASDFLPSHLARTKPSSEAGYLHGEISTLLADLFTQERNVEHLIQDQSTFDFDDKYTWFPTATLSDLGRYWIGTDDLETANKNAQLVLDLLLPEKQQVLLNYARSSDMASDACPFTVLFSHMVVFWSRRWLQPEVIREDDGWPAVLPPMLMAYHKLAIGSIELDANGQLPQEKPYKIPSDVLRAAELQGLEKTPVWHVRAAQALLLHLCYKDALEHFQIFLDQHEKSPSLSPLSLFPIHRGISRVLTKLGKHKEALKHLELSNSLHKDALGDEKLSVHDHVSNLLSTAQMRHRANLTEDAVAMANEAWDFVLRNRDDWWRPGQWYYDLFLFFNIFLRLYQPHRLRSVLEFATTHFQGSTEVLDPHLQHHLGPVIDHLQSSSGEEITNGLPGFLLTIFWFNPSITYRVLHSTLTRDDKRHLDILSGIKGNIDSLTWEHNNLAELNYLLATLLFDNGRPSLGIQGWYEVAALSDPPNNWYILTEQMRSTCNLVTLCLSDADIPLSKRPLLALDDLAQYSEICLILSSWFRDNGDVINARNVLRRRVKQCITLLSDDNPLNDINAFGGLFKTFLVASDSDEDLSSALYLIKQDDQRQRGGYNTKSHDTEALDADGNTDLSESLSQVRLANTEDTMDDDNGYITIGSNTWCDPEPLTQCSCCKWDIGSIHYWHFCRSCPLTALCGGCYRKFQSTPSSPDDAFKFQASCNRQHSFYYTGPFLQSSERVPEGMVPSVTSTGEKQAIWIEEWKDRLAEKWDVWDFEFEGGLSAWCMQVLPEPQRSRWSMLFSDTEVVAPRT